MHLAVIRLALLAIVILMKRLLSFIYKLLGRCPSDGGEVLYICPGAWYCNKCGTRVKMERR